jgi:hypothetical protein
MKLVNFSRPFLFFGIFFSNILIADDFFLPDCFRIGTICEIEVPENLTIYLNTASCTNDQLEEWNEGDQYDPFKANQTISYQTGAFFHSALICQDERKIGVEVIYGPVPIIPNRPHDNTALKTQLLRRYMDKLWENDIDQIDEGIMELIATKEWDLAAYWYAILEARIAQQGIADEVIKFDAVRVQWANHFIELGQFDDAIRELDQVSANYHHHAHDRQFELESKITEYLEEVARPYARAMIQIAIQRNDRFLLKNLRQFPPIVKDAPIQARIVFTEITLGHAQEAIDRMTRARANEDRPIYLYLTTH